MSSTDDTCLVRTSSARWRTGQNAASSRLAGRLSAGALLTLNGCRALSIAIPGTTGLKWNGGETSFGMWTACSSLYWVRFRLAPSTIAWRSSSLSSMPDSCRASVTIARVTVCVPASCMRAQSTPGTSVLPRPMLAK